MVGVVAGFCGCALFVFSTSRIPQSLTFSGGGKIARLSLNTAGLKGNKMGHLG